MAKWTRNLAIAAVLGTPSLSGAADAIALNPATSVPHVRSSNPELIAVVAILGWAFDASAAESSAARGGQPSLMAPDARVRGSSQRLVAAISDATAGSQTFRGLVDQIGRTDGIVYVMEGQCQHGVRACLILSMTVMGTNRVLWILIDPRRVDRDLTRSIGHELQHALEVLSHSSIRSGGAMTLLYRKEGSKEGDHFETDAAIKAGNAVRAELRESGARRKHCDQPLPTR
jgi:hypothetical protein